MPNQLGLDKFDLEDALSAKKEFMCSEDMPEFIDKYHLNLSMEDEINPRDAFGSHDDADHVYNTPRAWYMLRYFNPHTKVWDGPNADFTPCSDNLPWCMVPEKKITPEDIKYILSSHYQGTPYDPYGSGGDPKLKGIYRSIGINRNCTMMLIQIRPDVPEEHRVLEWVAFASNAFNVMAPFYANVSKTPSYLSNTTKQLTSENFYWASRMIAAIADASYGKSIFHVERYQLTVSAKAHALINQFDEKMEQESDAEKQVALREQANEEIAAMLKEETTNTLDKVLFELSNQMKNAFSRSDA